MLKIGIIVGSTRPGRKAAAVAKWVHDILKSRKDAEFEVVDIEDYKLPLLDEPVPPIMHQPHEQHDKAVHSMADEVIAWGSALKTLRAH